MNNLLKEICVELNYQERFSYEERVNLFNKYFINTSTKYLNPMLMLCDRISSKGNHSKYNSGFSYFGMGHSGVLKTAFNDQIKEGKSPYIKITREGNSYSVFKYDSEAKIIKAYMSFHLINDEYKINIYNLKRFFITNKDPIDFRVIVNEFLEDLKFNKMFKL